MQRVILNTTSLGTWLAVLRRRGRAASAITYIDALHTMQGQVTPAKRRMMKFAVDDNEVDVPKLVLLRTEPAGALSAKSVYADPVGQRWT